MPRIGKNNTNQTSVLSGSTPGWQTCLLTWYDPALGGINSGTGAANAHAPTASGEPYDPNAYTCAAPPSYAFGTNVTFRYGATEITCRVNDRGGAITGNHFDLSRAAANALGITGAGRVNASFRVTGGSGQTPAAAASVAASTAASSSGPSGPSSILDLLTSPADQIGGWLASIAVNLAKDAALGFVDVVIIPAWHWNQRAVMQYQQEMFADKSGKQLLWTAVFWGGGYWLLFTDPDQPGISPAPVRRSRLARHTRLLQSLPARQSLIKPKDVKGKTPKKPKPVPSQAVISQTGTMATVRTQRVKVTGTHAGTGNESSERIDSTGSRESTNGSQNRDKPTAPTSEPNPEHRTRTRSLPDRRGNLEGHTGPSARGGH